MKPDWKDAPEWANWLAQDKDGQWYWFNERPSLASGAYAWGTSGQWLSAGGWAGGSDWQTSLENRPTEVNLEYVDPYDQLTDEGTPVMHLTDREGMFGIIDWGNSRMEVQEGAVMNTPGYEELAGVLVRAYDQAASGKGKERHANDLPFDQQPMQSISDLLRTEAGMAYQAVKKIQEARGLPAREARVRELLGAINYIAGMVIWLEKQPVESEQQKQHGDVVIKNVWSGLPTAEQAGEGLKEMLRVMNSNPERLS